VGSLYQFMLQKLFLFFCFHIFFVYLGLQPLRMFQLGVAVESMWPLSLKSYAAMVKNWRIRGNQILLSWSQLWKKWKYSTYSWPKKEGWIRVKSTLRNSFKKYFDLIKLPKNHTNLKVPKSMQEYIYKTKARRNFFIAHF